MNGQLEKRFTALKMPFLNFDFLGNEQQAFFWFKSALCHSNELKSFENQHEGVQRVREAKIDRKRRAEPTMTA